MRERIDQAKLVLTLLKMPREQQNDRTASVLLSLLDLRPGMSWAEASGVRRWRTVEIMAWLREHYQIDYAANTRETLRRFSLHQMIEAGLVLYNPDDPARPVNSPNNCYQVAPEVLELLRQFGSNTWDAALAAFLKVRPGLATKYGKARKMARVAVSIPGGGELLLSPRGQSPLIRDIIEQFAPRFVPGAILLYTGDAGNKHAYFKRDALAALGVVVDDHGKLPDVVLHDVDRNWLILAEAASTHGPVDAKRHGELANLFANSSAGLVYVSAFPSRGIMRKYLATIAWETEAWTADEPDHLTHFNGERFLGPYA